MSDNQYRNTRGGDTGGEYQEDTESRGAPRYGRRSDSAGPRGRQYARAKKICAFCLERGKAIDYKDTATLRRYLTERGKIKGRRKTGTCARHQRTLAVAIKRARHLALLPFTAEQIRRY